jgi:hypothetical protein
LSAHPSGDAISTHLDLGGVGLESLRSEVLPPHVAIKTPPLFVEQQVRALAAKYPKAANSYREIFADYGGNPYLTQIGVAVKADRLSLEVGKKLCSDQVKVVQAWWGSTLDAEIRSQLKRDSIVDLGPHNLLLTGSGFFRFVSEVDFARPKISISTEFLRNLLLE